MARILLGVSGGIAAYKALEVVRLATGAGHAVRVLMTPAARHFVGPASFEGITGAPVLVGELDADPMRGAFPGDPAPAHAPIGHLEVAHNADVYLVAPASANTLAKLAAGIADSMVTTAFLACTAPRIVAPAMNDRMLADPATRANLEVLRERGVGVIEPEEGRLASPGERGAGRLPDPVRLFDEVEARLTASGPWDGLRVLVTAGGTREPIDAVRYVGNRSSGRMGLALAERAARRGAEVVLVAANVSLPTPPAVRRIDVRTADELAAACHDEFPRCHVLIMAAAVADFRPAEPADEKISKAGRSELVVRMEATEDVLSALAASAAPGQTLVGFAAEHGGEAVERARGKLRRKALNAIVVNDVSRGDIAFDAELNEVTVVEATGVTHVPAAPKSQVADAILDRIEVLRGAGSGTPAG